MFFETMDEMQKVAMDKAQKWPANLGEDQQCDIPHAKHLKVHGFTIHELSTRGNCDWSLTGLVLLV